jgi:hypothetical protein
MSQQVTGLVCDWVSGLRLCCKSTYAAINAGGLAKPVAGWVCVCYPTKCRSVQHQCHELVLVIIAAIAYYDGKFRDCAVHVVCWRNTKAQVLALSWQCTSLAYCVWCQLIWLLL